MKYSTKFSIQPTQHAAQHARMAPTARKQTKISRLYFDSVRDMRTVPIVHCRSLQGLQQHPQQLQQCHDQTSESNRSEGQSRGSSKGRECGVLRLDFANKQNDNRVLARLLPSRPSPEDQSSTTSRKALQLVLPMQHFLSLEMSKGMRM